MKHCPPLRPVLIILGAVMLTDNIAPTASPKSWWGRTWIVISMQLAPRGASSELRGEPSLAYSSWSNIAGECGQPRLNGGVHFAAAVLAGVDLRKSIGTKVTKYS